MVEEKEWASGQMFSFWVDDASFTKKQVRAPTYYFTLLAVKS